MRLTVVSSPICGGDIVLEREDAHSMYYENETVTLAATPRTGYAFQRWSGDTQGIPDTSASVVTIGMTGHRMLSADFVAPADTTVHQVTVGPSPPWQGVVTITTPCGSFLTDNIQETLSIQCLEGTDLSVAAAPRKGYRFSGWAGDLAGSAENATLVVDAPKVLTATFADIAQPAGFPWGWVIGGCVVVLLSFLALRAVISRRDSRQTDTNPR